MSVAPLTTCAEVRINPGSTSRPVRGAAPGGQPAPASPATAAGGSRAHPVTIAIAASTIMDGRRIVRNVVSGGVGEPVDHPLTEVLQAAARGVFPPVDGVAELM